MQLLEQELDREQGNLRRRIQAILESGDENILTYSGKTADMLIHELHVYYQELEYQNQELIRIQDELEKTKERYVDLFSNAPIGYIIFDSDHRILQANKAFQTLLGLTAQETSSLPLSAHVLPESQDDLYFHLRRIEKENKTQEATLLMAGRSGSRLHVRMTTGLASTGQQRTYRSILVDLTADYQQKQRIEYLIYHDTLTGLYNRTYLDEETLRIDVRQHLPISIVLCDVNGLKLTNDTFGHEVGDDLLRTFGTILQKACRPQDRAARLGGDEFVLLLPNTPLHEALALVKSIQQTCLTALIGHIPLSVAMGVATKTSPVERIEDIMHQAEDHMYHSKLFESPSIRGNIIKTITHTLYETHPHEEIHAKRVVAICERLGRNLGLGDHDIHELKHAALLHDIGKITLDHSIVNRTNILSQEQAAAYNRHPEKGYQILKSLGELPLISDSILHHHEHWDGHGYPAGLSGTEIPLFSRIIAVADRIEVLSSPLNPETGNTIHLKETIVQESGKALDPSIVDSCIAVDCWTIDG